MACSICYSHLYHLKNRLDVRKNEKFLIWNFRIITIRVLKFVSTLLYVCVWIYERRSEQNFRVNNFWLMCVLEGWSSRSKRTKFFDLGSSLAANYNYNFMKMTNQSFFPYPAGEAYVPWWTMQSLNGPPIYKPVHYITLLSKTFVHISWWKSKLNLHVDELSAAEYT